MPAEYKSPTSTRFRRMTLGWWQKPAICFDYAVCVTALLLQVAVLLLSSPCLSPCSYLCQRQALALQAGRSSLHSALVEQLAVALADARLAEQGFLQVVVVQPAWQPVGLCALDALLAAWLELAERQELVQLRVALRLLAQSHVVSAGLLLTLAQRVGHAAQACRGFRVSRVARQALLWMLLVLQVQKGSQVQAEQQAVRPLLARQHVSAVLQVEPVGQVVRALSAQRAERVGHAAACCHAAPACCVYQPDWFRMLLAVVVRWAELRFASGPPL